MSCSFHLLMLSPLQQAIALSKIVFDLSGITRSSSIPTTFPYPSHFGHAPIGLLNENRWSVGLSNSMPSSSKRVEKDLVLPLVSRISHSPLPIAKAFEIVSMRRVCSSASGSLEVIIRPIRSDHLRSVLSLCIKSSISTISPFCTI